MAAPSLARMKERIDQRGPDECWPWTGYCDKWGYGRVTYREGGKLHTKQAPRVLWALLNGPIPEGLEVCHRCDNPPCMNPGHWFMGTQADNNRDMVAKGRHPGNRTGRGRPPTTLVCPNGHRKEGANARVDKHGHVRCRQCARERGSVSAQLVATFAMCGALLGLGTAIDHPPIPAHAERAEFRTAASISPTTPDQHPPRWLTEFVPTTTTTTTRPAPVAHESRPAPPRTSATAVPAPTPAPTGSHEAWMAAAGIAPSDWGYVDVIVSEESGWRVDATNAEGTWGLCQALPGDKMATAGADWRTNPVTQLVWCNGYAEGRYGSWRGAYEHHVATGWW